MSSFTKILYHRCVALHQKIMQINTASWLYAFIISHSLCMKSSWTTRNVCTSPIFRFNLFLDDRQNQIGTGYFLTFSVFGEDLWATLWDHSHWSPLAHAPRAKKRQRVVNFGLWTNVFSPLPFEEIGPSLSCFGLPLRASSPFSFTKVFKTRLSVSLVALASWTQNSKIMLSPVNTMASVYNLA